MATRLYFPLTTGAPVSPAVDAAWQYISQVVRRALAFSKGTSAILAGTTIGPWTVGQMALDRQYVSEPLAPGTVFAVANTVTMQLMAREFQTTDDVDRGFLGVRIVSQDGATVRATVLPVANYGSIGEFIAISAMRNKTFASGAALAAGYTTVVGDRLVIEIGYSNAATGLTPNAAAKYGENAADLPVNETQQTDGAGWIEFSNTFTLATLATARVGARIARTPLFPHIRQSGG